jgi:hypothetical protein
MHLQGLCGGAMRGKLTVFGALTVTALSLTVISAGSSSATSSAASASAPSSPPSSKCKSTVSNCTKTDVWSGYSEYPQNNGDFVWDQSADWTVPQITCPSLPTEQPRASVWVGLWGSLHSMAKGTGWLPQIGTSSDCNRTHANGATYNLVWEMESQTPGTGNAVQYGLDCPGSKLYQLCGYEGTQPPYKKIKQLTISPGDEINAAVDLLTGSRRAGQHVRSFEIRLTDLTTGQFAVGKISTDKSVRRKNIAREGGTIVEDRPACGLTDFLRLSCGAGFNGLANFATPIQITHQVSLTNRLERLGYNEWVMLRHYGPLQVQLAQNSMPSGSARGDRQGLSFSVTWLHRF